MNQDLKTKITEIEKLYLTKEEFINIINNIDFLSIKCCELHVITGFIVDLEKDEVKPLTKNIELN